MSGWLGGKREIARAESEAKINDAEAAKAERAGRLKLARDLRSYAADQRWTANMYRRTERS